MKLSETIITGVIEVVLENFEKFTGKHLCQRMFLIQTFGAVLWSKYSKVQFFLLSWGTPLKLGLQFKICLFVWDIKVFLDFNREVKLRAPLQN